MGMTGQTLSAGSHASVHSVGLKGPRRPQIPLRSGVKPRRYLGLFLVKRTHVESLILLLRGYDLRYCLLTCLLLLRGRREYPRVLQEAPNTPRAGLPVPPRPVRPVLRRRWPPAGLEGGSEHPLGGTPRPPQAGAPGSQKKMAPQWPCRRLRTPPGLGSPSPPGRCARFSEDDGPPLALQKAPNTTWAGLPVPPRPVRPVLRR